MLGGDEIAARYGISQPLLINVVHTDFPLTGNSFQYTPKAILKCNRTFINIKKKQYKMRFLLLFVWVLIFLPSSRPFFN